MEHSNQKGQWGSRFGFLMAAIGSAVGLGNLWGFPYKMGNNGGFAFLIVYLALVIFVGVVVMLAELSLGRKSGKGVIAAYETLGKKYKIIGWFGWISPVLILGFYCMLGGYCIKYAIANIGDLFNASWGVAGADSAEFFAGFTADQVESTIYTLIFVALTMIIVQAGVSSGIEKFTTVAMPALFVMLLIVIIRSVTLPGADAGLEFIFKPNFEVFKGTGWINVLASAGGQMFFSLSLGMGIMITYGSYMKKEEDLQQNSLIIPLADTTVAVMASVAIMPAVFSAGQNPAQGPGLLFITLQTVFQAMGSLGPLFGFLFYVLVFIAAITSSISLTEAVSSSIMDRHIEKGKPINRRKIITMVGIFVALEGTFVALDGLGANGFPQIFGQSTWLDSFDLVSEGILMPLGAMIMAIVFGWIKPTYLDDEITYGGREFKMRKYFHYSIKFIAPPILLLVLLGQIDTFFKLGWFS